ncbi:MAG TPA: VapC toxin family PIN domain ribonuclease [Methylococcales bacterium]|nr:VapC toxin family PIN domain ribonuclease [Methylococcales bacterium]
MFISSITIGELRRGMAMINPEVMLTGECIKYVVRAYGLRVLRVPHYEHAIDKKIAATAITHDLILVTRNTSDLTKTGVSLLNPFH